MDYLDIAYFISYIYVKLHSIEYTLNKIRVSDEPMNGQKEEGYAPLASLRMLYEP